MPRSVSVSLNVVAVVCAALSSGCGSSPEGAPAAGGPPGGAFPPMGVEVVTLALRPVEQTSEFIGTVKSRLSRARERLQSIEGTATGLRASTVEPPNPAATAMPPDAEEQGGSR